MNLRRRIMLAQVPLLLALVFIGAVGSVFIDTLGHGSGRILADNYRSVLAMQRIKESVAELDHAALFVALGQAPQADEITQSNRDRLERELSVQEGNITETGEEEATLALRTAWRGYEREHARFLATRAGPDPTARYFEELWPRYVAIRDHADTILGMNQDAMVHKSDDAEHSADRFVTLLVVASAFGFVVATYASATLTTRILRPISVLGQASRRIGSGDLAVRANVAATDEIGQLAVDFNTMADRLQKYRASSLGELLEAQRASQAAIDSLSDPVLVLGLQGNLTQVNRAAETLLKVTVESGLSVLQPLLRETIEQIRQHVASGKGPVLSTSLEEALHVVTADGDRHFLPRGTPVYAEEGDVVGTSIVLQDVTRRLRFEELRNNLVATVAHEFRTPLTSLQMAIHLLTEQIVGSLNDKQSDLLHAAREDCERLQAIVGELLDLSRIQAGRMELRMSGANPEELVRHALEAQRSVAAQRSVQLSPDVFPGTERIEVDVERIQLVFSNLLLNAIRHSPAGSTVSVRARAEGGRIRFEVRDAGPGIPEDSRQAVFEKYFQLPGASTGGAGLGLFIAREIVHAHGGEIGVLPAPGGGSIFWFDLPMRQTPVESGEG